MSNCCKNKTKHPNHSQEISCLNRAIGQLEGIKRMIENGRYCIDILTQCKAVESAIKSIESNILKRHLSSCVAKTFDDEGDKLEKIEEVIKLFKKVNS